MVFLNNALCFLPDLIANHVPFIMTLYPGGGFGLNESESDSKLDMILASPLLKGIIATQSVTQVYLESRNCKVPVHKIYGVAISPIYFHDMVPRKRASSDSHVISICFVAERYMPKGVNKGYPQFIEAAQQLLRKFGNLRFSVVGSFDAEDILLDNDIRDSISFKGILVSADLRDFFFTQDIIISPNHPYMLHPGNFDGFPTASCVEASLCGVAVVCSDELKLNWCYSDWNDIVICNPTTQAIVKSVGKLIRNPDLFVNIGLRGQITSRNIFSPNAQLDKRVEVLKNYACSQGMDINFH
jgi:lipopolysaccharide transport system ATP-binding protein